MTTEEFGAIAVLLVGAAFAVVVARRIGSGKSYSTNPAMAVSRKEDPFSFWLSLLFPTGVAIGLTLVGSVALWHALTSR